tara:strand:+ start:2019 stop:3035 length:1017 start_codon:yes stop_codon:yes gene_type:complete
MGFFDRKEEVLEIKLTQYGKRLLGAGRFKPEFYAFYDDDITYDTNYGGFSEAQNDAHERIKETPRSRLQYTFDRVESSAENKDGFMNLKISDLNREYALPLALGQSDQGDKFPAWSVRALEGELSGTLLHTTGSADRKTGIIRIPQLTTEDLKTITRVMKTDELVDFNPDTGGVTEQKCDDLLANDFFVDGTTIFPDETTIELEVDRLILEINEYNVDGDYDNFDIEVFELVGKEEDLKPLYFQKAPEQIQEGVLVSDRDPKDTFFFGEPTEDNVEYYMNVQVDSEIGRRLLCSLLAKDTPDGLHSRRILNCEEFEEEDVSEEKSLYNFPNDSVEEEC